MPDPITAHATPTSNALEWPLVLERFASLCVSIPGAEELRRRQPELTFEGATARLQQLRSALQIRELNEPLSVAEFPSLERELAHLQAGAMLTGSELLNCAQVLEVAKVLRQRARQLAIDHPLLSATIASDPQLDGTLDQLRQAIETDGTVSDRASSPLRAARARSRELRTEIKRRLGHLLNRYTDLLQGNYYTEREGRYVLPVRADAHMRIEGIVLGSSSSGSTLFLEPRELTDLSNRLRVCEAEIEREEARVLSTLAAQLQSELASHRAAYAACVTADGLAALARYASETKAQVVELEREPILELRAARHPLLMGSNTPVVANDLVVHGAAALVISGPNAGGKTVALKTLGLAAWLAAAGLPVPVAEGSRIGWFDRVLCDIGDEQSIAQSLSTFSAHIVRLREFLQQAGTGSLILLDEVATGTDPEEGSALAQALLEAFTQVGATVAVTTHYERLKERALAGPPLFNASVGFDFHLMAPTFKLTLGTPGASSALLVAERHGLPHAVLDNARSLLTQHALEREALLARLENERQVAETARAAAQADAAEQARLLATLHAEEGTLRERAHAEIAQETAELRATVRRLRNQLQDLRRTLREHPPTLETVRQTERQISRVAAEIAVGSALSQFSERKQLRPAPEQHTPQTAQLTINTAVRVLSLNTTALVIATPERGTVRVQAGALKLTVPLHDLQLTPGAHPKTASVRNVRKFTSPTPSLSAEPAALRTTGNTLDVRGERAEECRAALEAFIDRLLSQNQSVGFVLHGHGTGALKQLVREQLTISNCIGHSRPALAEEGGDAFTVFWLKG